MMTLSQVEIDEMELPPPSQSYTDVIRDLIKTDRTILDKVNLFPNMALKQIYIRKIKTVS